MKLQKHHRDNYERTDAVLANIRVLVVALEAVEYAASPCQPGDQFSGAVHGLICLIGDQIEELDTTRGMEWVGFGGRSNTLSADEIALAMGDSQDAE